MLQVRKNLVLSGCFWKFCDLGRCYLTCLNGIHIRYHIRIRENFWGTNTRMGKRFKASWAFTGLRIVQSMKSSGFNIEDTHLADIGRIERLFAIVTIAFLWAYLAGIRKSMNVKPIRILNNGRKAVSIFKYGLDYIAECLLNPQRIPKFDVFQILSCT